MAQMKEHIKTQKKKKELNKMEISNLSDTELKTLVVRMLKKLNEDLSSTKKIKSEMKDTLTEIKNNLQGNNNRMDEAEIQINDMEHKEAKNNQPEQEKKEPPKIRIVQVASETTSSVPIFASLGYQKEKIRSKKLQAYLKN